MLNRRHDARPRKRHVLLAAATVAAGLSLTVAGVTAASLSTSRSSGTNAFAAGTLTLTDSAVANCPVTNLLPNTVAATCTFTSTYPGPAPAYIAVNVLIETQAGAGGTKLYSPSDPSNDLRITIASSNPGVSGYTVPTTATSCPGGAPSGSACYELDNELVSTTAVTSAAVGFSVAVSLPATSTTGYQGGTAQVIITTHAVQSRNNTLSCTATPTAGTPCTPSGSFKWS